MPPVNQKPGATSVSVLEFHNEILFDGAELLGREFICNSYTFRPEDDMHVVVAQGVHDGGGDSGFLVIQDGIDAGVGRAHFLGIHPAEGERLGGFFAGAIDGVHDALGLAAGLGDHEIEVVVVSGPAGELHAGGVTHIVLIEPRDDILVEEARDDGGREEEEVVHREHGLHEVVLAQGKVLLSGVDLQAIVVASLDAEALQRHAQEGFALGRVDGAAGHLQVFEHVAAIGEEKAAVIRLGVDLQVVVVSIKVRSGMVLR